MDFDPRKHDLSHYTKALDSYRTELHKLDVRERCITDKELLEKAPNTLIRSLGLGKHRTTDNGSAKNLLWDLPQELIRAKTTVGFVGRHKDSFKSFATLNSDVQLLAQQTNVNSSGTKAQIEYIPYTSVEWSEQSKSKKQLRTHITHDDDGGYGDWTGTNTRSTGSFDLDEPNVQDDERDEEHDDHDHLYMSQDHRGSSHQSNAPTWHAHSNARTGASQTRRPQIQQETAQPSASAWEVGRKINLQRGIDGRHVDQASRLLHPSLRQPLANTHAPGLSDIFPHRASSTTPISFNPGGSLSRHIETKLPIRQVLEKMVDMKRRLAGSHSKMPGEKGCLLDNMSKAVHEVLFTAFQSSGDLNSDDEADPVTGGAEFEAFVTGLHQAGRQAHLDT